MPTAWFVISAIAFLAAILLFLVSGFIALRIMAQLFPLLDETRNQVQDLGDLAANTVSSASETMDIVELRVSQAMGQAAISGKTAANQALGVGSTLAGLYMMVRLVGAVRSIWTAKKREEKRRGWTWRRKKKKSL